MYHRLVENCTLDHTHNTKYHHDYLRKCESLLRQEPACLQELSFRPESRWHRLRCGGGQKSRYPRNTLRSQKGDHRKQI